MRTSLVTSRKLLGVGVRLLALSCTPGVPRQKELRLSNSTRYRGSTSTPDSSDEDVGERHDAKTLEVTAAGRSGR